MPAHESVTGRKPDTLTLIAVSAFAYVLAVALHEHGGHATACVLLGSHPTELGAFYVNCDDSRLSAWGVRLVALAGPIVSVLTGSIAFLLLRRIPPQQSLRYYFVWLLGSVGLMSAAGYPLFSGVLGVGDLGTSGDGALSGARPELLWRLVLIAVGVLGYSLVLRLMGRRIAPCAGAAAGGEMPVVQRAAMISYFTGAALYLAIGAFNPLGWTIILISALPSSMGGTCGLLVMWGLYRRRLAGQAPGLGIYFSRSWAWIVVSALVVTGYAVYFGPTLRP